MDITAIGAINTMNQSQLQRVVDATMARMIMDFQETQAAALIRDLQQAIPALDHQLDILV